MRISLIFILCFVVAASIFSWEAATMLSLKDGMLHCMRPALSIPCFRHGQVRTLSLVCLTNLLQQHWIFFVCLLRKLHTMGAIKWSEMKRNPNLLVAVSLSLFQSLRMGTSWSRPRTRQPRTYAFPVKGVGVHVKETKESVIGDIAKDHSSMLLNLSTWLSPHSVYSEVNVILQNA